MLKNSEEGFVLVPVLWFSGLMAAVLSGFLVTIKIDVRAAANLVENAKVEYVADGVVRLVAYELASHPLRRMGADGRVLRCALDSYDTIFVRVQDQAGLVDLNAASFPTLQALGEALGLRAEMAHTLADKIIDFRDRDDDARPQGAEASEYRAAGLALPPKNAAFQDVAELDQLLGMTDELREKLAELVTVHSQQDGIDAATAPIDLKGVAPNMPRSTSQRRAFAIDAMVVAEGGGKFLRRGVIQILGRRERPFAVSEWKRGSARAAEQILSAEAQGCRFSLLQGKPANY